MLILLVDSFHAGLKHAGIDRNQFAYKAPFQPYFSYFGLFFVTLITLFNGFTVRLVLPCPEGTKPVSDMRSLGCRSSSRATGTSAPSSPPTSPSRSSSSSTSSGRSSSGPSSSGCPRWTSIPAGGSSTRPRSPRRKSTRPRRASSKNSGIGLSEHRPRVQSVPVLGRIVISLSGSSPRGGKQDSGHGMLGRIFMALGRLFQVVVTYSFCNACPHLDPVPSTRRFATNTGRYRHGKPWSTSWCSQRGDRGPAQARPCQSCQTRRYRCALPPVRLAGAFRFRQPPRTSSRLTSSSSIAAGAPSLRSVPSSRPRFGNTLCHPPSVGEAKRLLFAKAPPSDGAMDTRPPPSGAPPPYVRVV